MPNENAKATPRIDQARADIAPVFGLFAAYSLAVLGAIFLIIAAARSDGTAFFEENHYLEQVQVGILALGATYCWAAASRFRDFGVLFHCLGILCAMAAIRELDKNLDSLIPLLGWQLPFSLVLLLGLLTVWCGRRELPRQIRIFVNHRSFGMMWPGFIVAIPFGQLVGHGPFLRDLFGEDYERSVKRVIEESSEMIGYLIIALSGIDLALWLRKRPEAH